jgi:hypothetical protein
MKVLRAMLGLAMLLAGGVTLIAMFKLAGFWIGLLVLLVLVVGIWGK